MVRSKQYVGTCVANRMVNGTQQTICWHVDDLKLSHKSPREHTKVIKKLMAIYGTDMTVRRGKKHKYMGMDLDYSQKGKLLISMIEYNKATWAMWPEPLDKPVKTSPGENLLNVNADCPKLDTARAQLFHSIIARNLFSSKRSREDILATTAFCTTRVKAPDEDDWKKLGRCMQYLKDTPNDVLTLSADNIQIVKW